MLLDNLFRLADQGEPINLARLVSCYAWDVMGATTVGQRFGFMNMDDDVAAVIDSMADWKLYAVLYGTFFRFHPWLKAVFDMLTKRHQTESKLQETLECVMQEKLQVLIDKDEIAFETVNVSAGSREETLWTVVKTKSNFFNAIDDAIQDHPDQDSSLLTVLGALLLVGGDPLAVHLLTTIFFLSCNEQTVQMIRSELDALETPLSDPPTLQELAGRQEELPTLMGMLDETRRLCPSDTFNFTKLARPGEAGEDIRHCHVPDEVRFEEKKKEKKNQYVPK